MKTSQKRQAHENKSKVLKKEMQSFYHNKIQWEEVSSLQAVFWIISSTYFSLPDGRCRMGRKGRGRQEDGQPPLEEVWLPDPAKQQPGETNMWGSVTQDGRVLQRSIEEVKLTQEWSNGGQTRESWAKPEEALMLRHPKKPRRQVKFNLTISYWNNTLNSEVWISGKGRLYD